MSPHLDDAVLSCGGLIAAKPGTHIVTVFAGRPTAARSDEVTDWDRECGFSPGDDVVGARRTEDERACAALDTVAVWLDFVDGQYHEPAPLDAVTAALRDVVTDLAPSELFIPLGLLHRDHDRTHRACRPLIGARSECAYFAYEDSPYRAARDAVDARIVELAEAGLSPRPVELDADGRSPAKRDALACYRSQVGALERMWPGYGEIVAEERYWRIGP